jgi:hypothetical protein
MLTRQVLESPFKSRLRSYPKVLGNANGTVHGACSGATRPLRLHAEG